MRLVWARRLSQGFFLALFGWFVWVSTMGAGWDQLRGWPVNWLLQLDPLLALTSTLATGVLFGGLAWALVTVGLTILLGRFFCGWVCPLGALNQLTGWLAWRGKKASERIKANRPSNGQVIKYYVLVFVLASAVGDPTAAWHGAGASPWWPLAAAGLVAAALAVIWKMGQGGTRNLVWLGGALAGWLGLNWFFNPGQGVNSSLLSGLLDPLPFLYRGGESLFAALCTPINAVLSGGLADRPHLGSGAGAQSAEAQVLLPVRMPLGGLVRSAGALEPGAAEQEKSRVPGVFDLRTGLRGWLRAFG